MAFTERLVSSCGTPAVHRTFTNIGQAILRLWPKGGKRTINHCPLRTSAVQAQMTKHLPLLARIGNAASAQGPGPSFALEARLHFLGCAVRVAPAFRQPHALAETPVWTFLPNYLTQGKSHNAFFQHPYWDVHCSPRHTPILAASSSHPASSACVSLLCSERFQWFPNIMRLLPFVIKNKNSQNSF